MSNRVPSSAGRPVPVRVQLLVLAALALFVLVVPALANRPMDWGEDRVVGRSGGGVYVVLRGLPVLHVTGTPYEMGRQHGALLGKEIRAFQKQALAFWTKGSDPQAFLASLRSLDGVLPERYREELRGLAAGAGLTYDQVLTLNLGYDAWPRGRCSQFVALPELTGSGVLHARNLDFSLASLLQRRSFILVAEPEGSLPFVSLTWAGVAGVLTGMNVEGVTLALNANGSGAGFRPDGLVVEFGFRQALETTRTVAEAVDQFLAAPRAIGGILVASDSGGALVAEFTLDGATVRRPAGGWIAAANHFLADVSPRDASSPVRYGALRDGLIGAAPPLTVEQAIALLDRAAIHGSSYAGTPQSVVFLPGTRELYVSLSHLPATEGEFVRFTLEELLAIE